MTNKFDIIGAPFNQLSFVTTNKNTLDFLREMDKKTGVGLSDWIDVRNSRWQADIKDVGDVVVTDEIQALVDLGQKDAALHEYSQLLKLKLMQSFHAGRIPITIGGDHSIAVGSLQAVLQYYQQQRAKKVAVIWVDAHADCNASLDSNLHGKPLAILMNQYPHHGWSIPTEIEVSPENIFYIGVRDLMRNEYQLVKSLNITNYDMPFIEQHGFNGMVQTLLARLEQEFDHIYLSFDYDVLDGSIFRACATPNIGGLSAREALHLVHTLASSAKFIGAEFVEYMPELDQGGISKELMVKMIDAVWGFRM